MEDPPSSRPGAAALSKKAPNRTVAKSDYDDVFGGPPRYSAPFSARIDDYSEIFGGPANSCSIPVLDLPPAVGEVRSSGFDYSEVFGGFSGGDFAISYEELFAEPKRPEVSSSNGRTPKETGFAQQAKEVSEFPPEGSSKDHVSCLENNQFSSNSIHSDDGSKQFSISYHKTSRGSIDDVISGTTHITQLHAVPGFTFVINSCPPLKDVRSANPPNIVTNDLIPNAGYNGGASDGEQVKVVPPPSSCGSTQSCGADSKADQKQFTDKCPASEDATENVKHHSRSSSSHSISSGDISFPDATYLTVSDINLRTQPSRMPPPSRPPPKLVSKQGHPKMKMHTNYANSRADIEEGSLSKPVVYHQTHYSKGVSRSHTLQEVVKDGSPCFFDVEVDASSAAAASAAAMKEAMEQAQARLKSARESKERKQDNLQSHRKMGYQDKAAQEVKSFSGMTTQKTLLKEDKKMKEFAFNKRQKSKKAAKVAPNHEEKERYVVSAEDDQQMLQGNGFKSFQVPYKLEEISGEWKTEKQFYELINNKTFKTVKEECEQEGVEKKPEATTKVNEDKETHAKESELIYEFERNGKMQEANTTSAREENDENLEAGNMACKEELMAVPDTSLEACMWKENMNKLEEASDSHHQRENEKKLEATPEGKVCDEKVKKPNADEGDPARGEREENVEPSYNACKIEDVHEGEDEERKSETAEVACRCEDSEPRGASGTREPPESENTPKIVSKTGMQDKSENEIEVASGSCIWEAGEIMEAAEEANQCETSKKTRGKGKHENSHEENVYILEGTSSTLAKEEGRKLNRTQEACMCVENDLQFEGIQDANEWEENLKKLKAAQGTMGHSESKKMDSVKENCWQDYNERKISEAQLELQRNEKKQKAVLATWELENSEEQSVPEGDYGKRENENVKEVHVALDSEETLNELNASREVCQKAVDNDLEDAEHTSYLEKKGNSVSSAQAATESRCTVVTENSTPDTHKAKERENERRMERENKQEKERERKIKEEKEREREREKDRLAVERATREAPERVLAEARERAERIAVERVTAEARKRALAEAPEKSEKAAAEVLEKSLAEKASRKARLRAERAAVERATAEARERAVERAIAEKDAREHAERLNGTSRDRTRKDNEEKELFRASDKEDSETRLRPTSVSRKVIEVGEGESALRSKARLERHQRTVERAAKALAEKNLRDVLAQREQAERNRLAELLDADVKRWSNGKEGNLRALLSTLQYILGPESGWQPVPLTDVITAAAVKKAYRKATLCVHPDKLQQRGASIQQKYICEKVFDLLKEAWNRFNSEEER